jgi:histidine triad (HIT) family protein
MGTIFDRVMRGEVPSYFVWEDDVAVAFLDIHPHADGHTLVIPRRPESHWTGLSDPESERLFWVAKQIGSAQRAEFDCVRTGLVVAGYHVPHVHIHVFPSNDMSDFDFRELPPEGDTDTLAQNMVRLRQRLRSDGLEQFVPGG